MPFHSSIGIKSNLEQTARHRYPLLLHAVFSVSSYSPVKIKDAVSAVVGSEWLASLLHVASHLQIL